MAKSEAPRNPVAVLAPSRLPIVSSIAKEFDVTADQWRVLVDQIFPAAKTVEAVGMALAYCRARNLDIFKRPVHIVPMWSTVLGRMVETVWPGIAEIRTTAHRTGNYAGIDPIRLGPMVKVKFADDLEQWEDQRKVTKKVTVDMEIPEYAEATIYRMVEGQRMPFTATVYWEEAYASIGKSTIPNTMWQKRKRGQIAKCVEAAALRMGFPEELGNVYVAEEMEGRTIDAEPAPTVTKEAPPAPAIEPPSSTAPAAPTTEPDTTSEPADDETAQASRRQLAADFAEDLETCQTELSVQELWSEKDIERLLFNTPELDEAKTAMADRIKAIKADRVQEPSGDDTEAPPAPRAEDVEDFFPGDVPGAGK